MIWFFDQRKRDKEALERERLDALAALEQSKRDLEQTTSAGPHITGLADRLRAIQQNNHFAVRLRRAYTE